MRVGISPLHWPRDEPLESIFSSVAEIGYQGVEGAREYFEKGPALRTLLADQGIQMAAGPYRANWFDKDWRQRELDGVRRHAEFYAGVGAEYLVASSLGSPRRFETAGHMPTGRNDGLSDYQWGCFADTVSTAADICKDEFSISLVFQNRAGTYVETGEEVDRFIALTNPNTVLLAPDTGHLFYAGIDPVAFFERNVPRIALVHLKDVDSDVREQALAAKATLWEFARMNGFTEIGAGIVDFEAIIEILRGHSYRGWLIVEQEFTSRDAVVAAGASLEFVNSLLKI